jgi:hypothetical protein
MTSNVDGDKLNPIIFLKKNHPEKNKLYLRNELRILTRA